MGHGRFGPVFVADDPASGQRVVIRTFVRAATAEQREALAAALGDLAQVPLEHPAIARPLAAGIEDDVVYLAQTYLPGVSAADYLETCGPQRLAALAPRLTQIAAALDFAAATGVYHGDLTLRDIIIGPEGAGVSGLGYYRALQRAGLEGIDHLIAARERDLRALVGIVSELLAPPDRAHVDAVTGDLPDSALAFVAALPHAVLEEPAPVVNVEPEIEQMAPPIEIEQLAPPIEIEPEIRQIHPEISHVDPPVPEIAVERTLFGHPVEAPPVVQPPTGARRSGLLTAVAASLAIGVTGGFAAGYVIGGRQTAPALVATAPATPAATSGRAYTDEGIGGQESAARAGQGRPAEAQPPQPEPVQEPTVKPEPVAPERPVAAPTPRTARAEPSEPTERPERLERSERSVGPAALFVDSHPSGAQVFVDGALVGRTPMLMNDVRPGAHAVRMEMPTYRSWRTTVDVTRGLRTRVAASLEQ